MGDTVVADDGRSVRRRNAERYAIGAVSNALALLGALAQREGLALGEAAESPVSPRARRIACWPRWRAPASPSDYRRVATGLGATFVRWASQLLGQLDVRSMAEPILRRLRDETGETVNLAVLRDTGLVYVAILESPSPFRMADEPGRRGPAPLHGSGQGGRRTPRPASSWRHAGRGALRATHARYVDDLDAAVQRALHSMRADGYAVDREEVAIGVTCVAVAIRLAGDVVGAISVSAPRARMDDASHHGGRRTPGAGGCPHRGALSAHVAPGHEGPRDTPR